jgi:hypothetical protein
MPIAFQALMATMRASSAATSSRAEMRRDRVVGHVRYVVGRKRVFQLGLSLFSLVPSFAAGRPAPGG